MDASHFFSAHEQHPAVFSSEYACPNLKGKSEEYLIKGIRAFIVSLLHWVAEQGGMVGHIKALVENGGVHFLSSTGAEIRETVVSAPVQSRSETAFYVTAIIFKVSEEKLAAFCGNALSTLAGAVKKPV